MTTGRESGPGVVGGLGAAQWRQIGGITVAALAAFLGLRLLPTGTNLSHMDFRVDPKGGAAIEFCDPANPQFIPVVAVRSPVTLALETEGAAVAGRETRARVTLRTGGGKPIAPGDLLVTHTRRLHLLIVDPSLSDYHHVHPEPGGREGEWRFAFTPRRAGVYRVFADFTPAATARGLYASADLTVAGEAGVPVARAAGEAERDGMIFRLEHEPRPARAGKPIELRFEMARRDGGVVALDPVMGALAHLVAFDEGRSGFAHLHPVEAEAGAAPDARRPALRFQLTIPRAGRYTIWAQINVGGRETFVPLGIDVEG